MGEGEANGGDDGMGVGPMGVGSGRGQRGIVLNNHLIILNNCTAKTLLNFT
jgi:hypothetical protein